MVCADGAVGRDSDLQNLRPPTPSGQQTRRRWRFSTSGSQRWQRRFDADDASLMWKLSRARRGSTRASDHDTCSAFAPDLASGLLARLRLDPCNPRTWSNLASDGVTVAEWTVLRGLYGLEPRASGRVARLPTSMTLNSLRLCQRTIDKPRSGFFAVGGSRVACDRFRGFSDGKRQVEAGVRVAAVRTSAVFFRRNTKWPLDRNAAPA